MTSGSVSQRLRSSNNADLDGSIGHSPVDIAEQMEEALDGDDHDVLESCASHLGLQLLSDDGRTPETAPIRQVGPRLRRSTSPGSGSAGSRMVFWATAWPNKKNLPMAEAAITPFGSEHPKCLAQRPVPVLGRHQMEQGSHHHHAVSDGIGKGKLTARRRAGRRNGHLLHWLCGPARRAGAPDRPGRPGSRGRRTTPNRCPAHLRRR